VSPRRQHFNERGLASETFGFPGGRDLGVMAFGGDTGGRLGWWVGVFDGAGLNVVRSTSSGHVASGRVGYAPLGTLPREEGDIQRSAAPNVALGLGAQGATRNEIRSWDLGRSPAANGRADWLTGTGDVSIRWQGASLAADGYLRRVWPDDLAVDPYTGAGFMVSGGYTLITGRLDVVGRWSEVRLDREDPWTERREWGLGLNLYLVGHDAKTRIQLLSDRARRPDGPARGLMFFIEQHVQF
jgi:hypothetical protein